MGARKGMPRVAYGGGGIDLDLKESGGMHMIDVVGWAVRR